jgi:hypothetical protein
MDARRAQESWSYLPICLFDTSSAHHAAAGLLLAQRNPVRESMETQDRGCIHKYSMLVCGCVMRVGSGILSRSQQRDLPLSIHVLA